MPGDDSAIGHDSHASSTTLTVIGGDESGRVYVLRAARTTIGRADDNDIALADVTVSRHHASILRADDGRWLLRDDASVSGVHVNGLRVISPRADDDGFPLADGDEIGVGQIVLLFHAG